MKPRAIAHIGQRRNAYLATLALGIISILGSSDCAFGDAVQNNSFEQGLANWANIGAGIATTRTIVTDSKDGTSGLLIANRTSSNAGVRQSILANLKSIGSGKPITTKFWIKLSAPASARCQLLLNDGSGSTVLTLAEQTFTDSGSWVQLVGTRKISWQGTLTQATLYFDVAQIVVGAYPSYTLDYVRVNLDTDADGIPDSEEGSGTGKSGSNASLSDTDSDGMPDGWELDYGFNPTLADGSLDSDGDGFSNYQEYWAATDPHDSNSYPGKPSDSGANNITLAILRYLALVPSSETGGHVLVGQHATDPQVDYPAAVDNLYAATGKWPALVSLQYDDGTNPLITTEANARALEFWNKGGLVLIKWSLKNPWTQGSYTSVRSGSPAVVTDGPVDLDLLADPQLDPAVYAVYQSYLDEAAAGLAELQNQGVTVLWRPFSEMTGVHFWWGYRKRSSYVNMWRQMHDYFTNVKGLHNLIWVYESHSPAHSSIPTDYYYPGDDYVDVIGHNFYDDGWTLPFESNQLFRAHPKVYAFPQAGSGNTRDGSWSNLVMVDGIEARFRRCSFFGAWSSFTNGTFQARAIVDQRDAAELMDDDRVITLDKLDWASMGLDFDGDGIPDHLDSDDDNDGLSDADEITAGTDPHNGDSDNDGLSDGQEVDDGSDPTDRGSFLPVLSTKVCAESNGFFSGSMWNVLEHINMSSSSRNLKTELYDINGTSQSSVSFGLNPGQQFDVLVDDMPGWTTNSYGKACTTVLNGQAGELDGRMVYYKPSANPQNANDQFEFAFAMPFLNGVAGAQFVPFNTYQASLDPADQDNFVANWIQITNLESNQQDGTLLFYDQAGALLGQSEISIGSEARVDVSAHQYGPWIVGLVEWRPESPTAKFQLRNVRYLYDNPTLADTFDSAFQLDASIGSGRPLVAPLDTAAQTAVVELANTLADVVHVRLTIHAADGTQLHDATYTMSGHATLHIIADSILNGGQGAAFVQGDKPESVIATVMQYGRTSSGGIEYMYGVRAEEALGASLRGSYNTFLNQRCSLQLTNSTLSDITANISMVDSAGSVKLSGTSVHIAASGMTVFDACEHGDPDTYGVVTVQPSATNSLTATLLRIGPYDNYRFPTPVRQ